MANPLNINIVRVQNMGTGQFTYGFIAKDNYGSVVDVEFDTMEDFLQDFPKQETLIHHVISHECMVDSAVYRDGALCLQSVSAVNVIGWPK